MPAVARAVVKAAPTGHNPDCKILRQAQDYPARKRTADPMALRDTWHRALVYFGLAEDYGDEHGPYEPETGTEGELLEAERAPRTASVRRLDRRPRRDEIDDIFADEPTAATRTRTLRPVEGNGGAEVQVHLVTPRNFNDAQEVADNFKRGLPVIMNLQSAETELSRRLIDFTSGLTYALGGGMQKIADKTFLLTPANVEVSAEQQARLVEKGFFNQS
jgi:cell division inhibitor SepF